MIRQNRAGRAIVLTTHSMEEADLLADSIAIMAAGRLVAAGTPLDLKARYGVGYTLTIVKQRAPESDRSDAHPQHCRDMIILPCHVKASFLHDLASGA